MRRLIGIFVAATLAILALWLVSLPAGSRPADFWHLRRMLIYLTGLLAIGFMSLALLLAARPVQIESALGGLDRYY